MEPKKLKEKLKLVSLNFRGCKIGLCNLKFLDDVCQFGDKEIKKGQTFEKTNITTTFGTIIEKIECKCTLPPLVKCHTV